MNKITELNNRYGEYIQLAFKAAFLIHLLLCYNIMLVGTGISKAIMLITVLAGGFVLLSRLVDIKEIICSFEGVIILAFAVSYVISIAANADLGIKEGAKYLVWLALLLGGVFWVKRGIKSAAVRREMLTLSIVLVAVVTVFNLVSVGMLAFKYSSFYGAADGNYYLIGFANWGRLYGLYVDPNYGGVISCIAVIAAVFCMFSFKKVWLRVIFAVTVIPNLLYCAFSASRTGKLCLVIGLFVLLLVYLWKRFNRLYALKSAAAALCIAVFAFFLLDGIQWTYNSIQHSISRKNNDTTQIEALETEQVGEVFEIGRKEEELQGDVSNRRFDIWKNALAMYKQNPLLGIGWKNIIPYVEKNMPDSYMLGENNKLADFDVCHNSFIDVFVFQGSLGGIIMIVLAAYVLVLIFKKLKRRDYDKVTFSLIVSGLILCTFSGCVLSVLVYYNSALSYLFWLFMGYVIYYCKSEETI